MQRMDACMPAPLYTSNQILIQAQMRYLIKKISTHISLEMHTGTAHYTHGPEDK